MKPKERVELGQRSLAAFNNARKLEKQLQEYKSAPLIYESQHPDFDVDETIRLYQEFMDEFDKTFKQLQEDFANGQN